MFEQLFVSGAFPNETAEGRAKRIRDNLSVLDFVIDDAKLLKASLGLADRAKLDQYLTAVRDLEKRIAGSKVRDFGQEFGSPNRTTTTQQSDLSFGELAEIMFDLQVLALQGNRTRVITFSYGHEGSNRVYPQLGIAEGHENLVGRGARGPGFPRSSVSPGQDSAAIREKIAKINVYHTTLFASFLQKLQAIPEGSGTLLDNCLVSYGSSLSDDFNKSNSNLPIIVAGSGSGALKTGQHLAFDANKKTPLNNLWLALLDIVGASSDKFGDSTGKLTEVLA